MGQVHPTAIVEEGAQLADDVSVGAYCVVGPKAILEAGVTLHPHVVVAGNTRIGEGTVIYPFASIGQPPQHLGYQGEDVRLLIGKNNIIREHVTLNPGTGMGRGETRIGDNGLFMAGSHVAHDSIVGDHVIFANNATIGGHVVVGSYVFLGGLCAVHQYSRIGDYAFVGGMAGLEGDLIPYGSCMGNRAYLGGLNIVGMKRRKTPRETIHAIRGAYRMMFAQEGTFQERVDDVAEMFPDRPEVMQIVSFVRAESNRPLCMPRPERGS